MHQDQRIGLALAVLLLGAAGAFFFRNDPKPARPSPRLKSARAIDARISEMQHSPYLSNSDDESDAPGTDATTISDRKSSATDPSEGDVQELAPIPFPPGVTDDISDELLSSRNPAKYGTPADRMHVVQKGETLSSIAAKELGSSGRFSEIFEANRDQLNDANDVRIGMSLRIPTRRATRSESATVNRSTKPKISAPPLLPSSESDRSTTSGLPPIIGDPDRQSAERPASDGASKKKFEPAKKAPLGIQGLGTQSSEVDPPIKPRKLTQLPPKEAGGKVAR